MDQAPKTVDAVGDELQQMLDVPTQAAVKELYAAIRRHGVAYSHETGDWAGKVTPEQSGGAIELETRMHTVPVRDQNNAMRIASLVIIAKGMEADGSDLERTHEVWCSGPAGREFFELRGNQVSYSKQDGERLLHYFADDTV